MNDGLLGAHQRFIGPRDQMITCLGQYLDCDVVGNQILVNQRAHKIEISLAGRGETHFDFLVPHAHQHLEHDALALRTHRVD